MGLRGLEMELAPDRFFDIMRGAFIILSKRLDGFPGLVPVSNHGRRDARPHEDRTAKGDIRIDDHHFGFIGLARTGKEVEFHRSARGIALNTGEIHTQDIPHSKLSILRDVDQLPIFLDKKMHPIGLEALIRQRMGGGEVRLEVTERFADLGHGDVMVSTQRVKDMRLYDIHKREQQGLSLREPQATRAEARKSVRQRLYDRSSP